MRHRHSRPGREGCPWRGRRDDGWRDRSGRPIYRSRHGFILGVCRGLADHFGLPVFWVRAGALMLLFFTGLWPVAAIYLALAFILKPEPVVTPSSDEEREFYDSYAASPEMGIKRVKRQFDAVERRLRRLEDRITSREFDWERRFGR